MLPSFITRIKALGNMERRNKLIELSQLPGVYIPSLYKPEYDYEIKSLNKNHQYFLNLISPTSTLHIHLQCEQNLIKRLQ